MKLELLQETCEKHSSLQMLQDVEPNSKELFVLLLFSEGNNESYQSPFLFPSVLSGHQVIYKSKWLHLEKALRWTGYKPFFPLKFPSTVVYPKPQEERRYYWPTAFSLFPVSLLQLIQAIPDVTRWMYLSWLYDFCYWHSTS